MVNTSSESASIHPSEQLAKLEEELSYTEDTNRRAAILFELGFIEGFRKDYNKSIKYLEEAQKLYNAAKNTSKIIECLAELAIIHYKNCNDRLIRSLTLLNDAKYLLENTNPDNKHELEALILHHTGLYITLKSVIAMRLNTLSWLKTSLTRAVLSMQKFWTASPFSICAPTTIILP